MTRSKFVSVCIAILATVLSACNGGVDYGEPAALMGEAGSSGEAGSAGSTPTECSPGSSAACSCDGLSGTKKCKSDGSGYESCVCETTDGGAGGSDGGGKVCDPGIYRACSCGELSGTERCKADGSGFDTCVCETEPDAGVCVPNEVKTTGCCGDGKGEQTCRSDGSGWGDCMNCETPEAGVKCGQYEVGTEVTTPCCAGGKPGKQICLNTGIMSECYGCASESHTHYRDSDGDTFGNGNDKIVDQNEQSPAGYVNVPGDCDDDDKNVVPGSIRSCNCAGGGTGTQQCVNGAWTECSGCSTTQYTYYADKDGDSYVSDTDKVVTTTSTPPAGYKVKTSSNGGDCKDNDATVHPGATEECNNEDDNCDGQVDEGCQDGGETMDTVTIDFSDTTDWSVPVIKGRWNGRPEVTVNGGLTDWYAFTGCTSSGSHAVSCTFTVPHIAITSLVFQVSLGSNRYWGDASGNSPAPCRTPAEMASVYQSSVTMIGTVTLKVNGTLQSFHMCANGTPKLSTCSGCCSASGSMPYYNGVNGTCE